MCFSTLTACKPVNLPHWLSLFVSFVLVQESTRKWKIVFPVVVLILRKLLKFLPKWNRSVLQRSFILHFYYCFYLYLFFYTLFLSLSLSLYFSIFNNFDVIVINVHHLSWHNVIQNLALNCLSLHFYILALHSSAPLVCVCVCAWITVKK